MLKMKTGQPALQVGHLALHTEDDKHPKDEDWLASTPSWLFSSSHRGRRETPKDRDWLAVRRWGNWGGVMSTSPDTS